MIRGVVFDMDGLLIDSEPLWRRAEIEVFGTVGVTLTDAMCSTTMGLRMDAVVDHWFERTPWTGKSREQIADEIHRRVAELVASEGEPLEGVEHIFSFFAARSLPIALCSSSPPMIIDAAVERLRLRDRLRATASGAHEEHGKPHPAAYMRAASMLGVAPQTCLAFEDSLNGMISAKAARMKVVAVPERGTHERTTYDFCDAKIASLLQFDATLFERLGGSAQ
jgi:sugar-phosphatase